MHHYNVPSEKNPDVKYLVSIDETTSGRTCTCPAFKYTEGDCKHIRAVLKTQHPATNRHLRVAPNPSPGVDKAGDDGVPSTHVFDTTDTDDIAGLLLETANAITAGRTVHIKVE